MGRFTLIKIVSSQHHDNVAPLMSQKDINMYLLLVNANLEI